MVRISVPPSVLRFHLTRDGAGALALVAWATALALPFTSVAQVIGRATKPTTAAAALEPAPATNPAAVDAEIDALLAHFASDDWPTRTAAQDRLTALAELAEPRLKRAARDSDDAEVRTRCEATLQQIAENRLTGPTPITMRVHSVHPRIAFGEVARQAGVELKPQHPTLWNQQFPTVTLDVHREPFWDVVGRIRQQCGLDLEPWQSGLAIMHTGPRGLAGAAAAPTATHGPFRIRATRVSRSYAVDLTSGGVAVNEFSVLLSFQAEPKLKISRGDGMATVELAEDENGQSLVPGDAAAIGAAAPGPAAAMAARRAILTDHAALSGSAGWPVTARLKYPPAGAGKRIARLKGKAACSVVVRSDTLELPDVLTVDNVTKEIGGTVVTIRSCRKVGAAFELVLSMVRADVAAPAAARVLRVPRQAYTGQAYIRLLDANGRDLQQHGASTSSDGERIEMTLHYAAAPPAPAAAPAKLLWEVPADVREMEIPFEFTDLPLP